MPTRPSTDLTKAKRLFASEGLTLPPIPGRFVAKVRELEPWCFGTRNVIGMRMYFFDDYLWEPLARNVRSYVAFSHAGHGINSYAITYQLVDGPLALFVQQSFGGGYSNKETDARAVKEMFDRCAELIGAVEDAKQRGLHRPPGRLIVVESDLRACNLWGWFDKPFQSQKEAARWWRRHAHDEGTGRGRPTPASASARLWVTGFGL